MKNIEAFTNPINFSIKEEQNIISKVILLVICIFIFCFFIWISFSQINVNIQGVGKIIQSVKLYSIQSVDGGVIEKIFVKEGDVVKENDKLVLIENIRVKSNLEEINEELKSLNKKLIRLNALINITDINNPPEISFNDKNNYLLKEEITLYNSTIENIRNSILIAKAKSSQLKNNVKELQQTIGKLEENKINIQKQLKIVEEGVLKNIIPIKERLNLELQYSNIISDIKINKTTIDKLNKALEQSVLEEIKIIITLQEKSLQEKLEIKERINILESKFVEQEDKVRKTYINSPINGIVNNILKVETNVVNSSESIIELVPKEEELIIEGKIKPKDIGELSLTNKVVVKVSAYDFSIYGGISGEIINIGADTITSEDGKETYYRVLVKLDSNYLIDKKQNKKFLIPGMITDIDILIGKRTPLEYILKPIIKTLGNSFNEK